MADDSFKVRHVERLKIKIGEAKNLPTRNHGSSNQRDVYCSLSLDQEEIFRTPTVYQTLSPFFGEEFQFDIPRNFRYISIYVFDRDRQNNKQDKILGKVAIRRENLASYNNKDHWFPIKAVDADSEVQGKANVEIKFVSELQRSKNSNYCTNTRKLVVQVKECRDLTLKNGACDPYALVSVAYSNSKRIVKRTKVRKKTTCPQFEDVFVFNVCEESDVNAEICELLVSLWHDTPGKGEDVFLGEVRVQLTGPQQQKAAHENAWYLLQPRSSRNRPILMHSTPPGTRLSSDNSLGSLRLQVQYTEDRVFPAATYDNLKALILQSLRTQPITNSSVYVLGEIINKIEIAPPLVRILLHSEKVEPIINSLAAVEISKVTDPTTIFRGNTLVSKMMDEAMRLIGLHYLHKTLRPTLDLIFREKKPCEIDPTRVKDPNTIQTNQANLKSYIQRIFDDITQSAVHCPALICKIFHNLKECAILYFPNNKEVRYSVISGFIFLRFFAPAILGPRLFDLTTQAIDCQTNRTLTLISKTIQSLGNLVSCRSSQQVCKEEYMECLYKEFCTETHKTAMRKFLEIISANTSSPRTIVKDKPVILKEGEVKRLMIKRSHGRKRFGRKNFKERYFKLTTQSLSYSKSRGKDALYEMPLSNILAAERVAETSFKMKNMFQIIQPGRVLYVQAANCVDEKEWMDLLTKICQTNANRLRKYHPAAFINGEWMCCKSSNESASGCSEVSNSDCNNHHMSLDPERDLQRIHSLIMSHLSQLERYVAVLEERDPGICNILKKLMEVSFEIERQHRIYKRTMDGNVEKGTLAAPIGDDNYLLASRMNLRGVTTTESSVS